VKKAENRKKLGKEKLGKKRRFLLGMLGESRRWVTVKLWKVTGGELWRDR